MLLFCLYLLLPAPAAAAVKADLHHQDSAKRTHYSRNINKITAAKQPSLPSAAAREIAK
jgi:hypothetical protein